MNVNSRRLQIKRSRETHYAIKDQLKCEKGRLRVTLIHCRKTLRCVRRVWVNYTTVENECTMYNQTCHPQNWEID